MKRIIVIDNYDSFTYNLVHYIEKVTGIYPDVARNDEITVEEVGDYDKILLSPGPGVPEEAGICIDLIKEHGRKKSILGICLGHQAIGQAYGGTLLNLTHVFHGVSTVVRITDQSDALFNGIPPVISAGRYHSWIVLRDGLPDNLKVICEDDNGMIMGISHAHYDVKGLQFHPESVLTEHGLRIIGNWVES
jgi:anthranilate synthase component 2